MVKLTLILLLSSYRVFRFLLFTGSGGGCSQDQRGGMFTGSEGGMFWKDEQDEKGVVIYARRKVSNRFKLLL